MSPHVTSIRDGNTIAIPEAFRPAGYEPSGFRVESPASEAGHRLARPETVKKS
jgi:hypothetical protein